MRHIALSLALVTLASPLVAQTVSIGSVAGIEAPLGIGATAVDMSHPATASGQVTTAFVRYSANSCTGQLKLKIVRLDPIAGVFNVVAERGPFSVVRGANRLTLTPPVDVLQGDLVATVSSGCGNVTATHARWGDFVLLTNSDFPSGQSLSGFNINRDTRPLVQLTSDPTLLAGVVPAAGSLAGGFGSFFRTSMNLANPTSTVSQGRIVFHPAGAPASANDPFLTFNLQPNTTSVHPDVVTEMHLSGLGSVDIVLTNGAPPVVSARVFNDQGDSGTSGFDEPMIAPSEAMHAGDAASFTLPGDLGNFRVNVGVRSLSPTTISISYHDSAGVAVGQTLFKSYAANFYEQVPLSSFLNGQQATPGGLVEVSIQQGDAIVYFSTTDNRTNDTSATMLRSQP
jgi:hypothetical protein